MSGYDDAVLAWAAHLRSGGTTPWSEFWPTAPTVPGAGELTGAAQLELVRRLAQRWSGPGFEPLADRVFHRDPPGRGVARLPLLHPGLHVRSGAPATDPGEVPPRELIRLGTGVLADLATTRPPRRRAAPRRGRRSAPFVLGAPVSRHALARGVDGYGRKDVLVCAPSLDELLTEVWSTRTQLGAGIRWRTFVQLWAGRDLLPLSADPAGLAAQAARRVGSSRVHVFVGSAARAPAVQADPLPLSVESVDLLRRVNPVLAVNVPGPSLPPARASALALLAAGDGPPARLAVPRRFERWARVRAERIAESLSAGGYAVHGDLDELVSGTAPAGAQRHPRADQVLDRLLEVVVRAVQEEQR